MGRPPKLETPDSSPKKERLTVSQLASYDDILTDALVDHVYFWTIIRKNRAKYNLTRGFSEEDVTAILFREVIINRDLQKAEAELLGLSGLKKFANSLRTEREKEDFRRHTRKYINIWLPDCPFEVSTTNRYTIVTHEAAITCRRPIRQGETIRYLCGNMVQMTPAEMEDLDLTRRDFSVVMTSRKKTPALFLGPARFANHDCSSNARLVPRGSESMEVVALRSISIGEEITVNYGEHYFGEDNCECLCATCEAGARGGWPGGDKSETDCDSSTPEEDSESDTPKSKMTQKAKRQRTPTDTDPTSSSSEGEEDADTDSPSKKRKLSPDDLPAILDVAISEETLLSPATKTAKGGSPLRKVLHVEDIIVDTETEQPNAQQHLSLKEAGQHGRTSSAIDELLSGVRAAFAGVSTMRMPAPNRHQSKPSAHIASQTTRSSSDPHVPYRFSSPFSFLTGRTSSNASGRQKQFFHRARTNPVNERSRQCSLGTSSLSSSKDSTFSNVFPQKSSPGTTPSAYLSNAMHWRFPQGLTNYSFNSATSSALSSPLSSLTSIAEIDDTTLEITPKHLSRGRGRPRKFGGPHNLGQPIEAKVNKMKPGPRTPRKARVVQPTIEVEIPLRRTPGDYIRTRLLLGESHSRWVDCRTCETCWVQPNGYQTRKECPRCERHSKLYGYQWPKTEKLGKHDDEERVMDHRTVHRFIPREEEKQEMKRGRGVGRAEEGAGDSERSESTGDDVGSSERTDSRTGRSGSGRQTRCYRPVFYTR